ncbi:ATP-grasp fold amidoligase family protein [Vreelandella alkaliphila]|uniref:ATP-grasp fold amidoligase family protein n=1 Tax=Vreelandella alkaliphila TaxID=272774 RepID=UPI003FD755CC
MIVIRNLSRFKTSLVFIFMKIRSLWERGAQEAIELSRIISINSPVPLLRIDFLVREYSLCLGEITPNPGRYAGAYSIS